MWFISLFFGSLVGLSLGLTGGGGAIFAVPLLVYGLDQPAGSAVSISLVTVGVTAFAGFLERWRRKEVELRTGFLFAVSGSIGAPIGSWLSRQFSDGLILSLFGGLMLLVAIRMWRGSFRRGLPVAETYELGRGSVTCERTAGGELVLTTRCALRLLLLGCAAGVLSGLFGVGGGFVIVPALVLFSQMEIRRAIGTSLFVIALVSVSGLASQWLMGRRIPMELTVLFGLGGIGGLLIGSQLSRRIPAAMLQRLFALGMVLVGVYVIVKNLSV